VNREECIADTKRILAVLEAKAADGLLNAQQKKKLIDLKREVTKLDENHASLDQTKGELLELLTDQTGPDRSAPVQGGGDEWVGVPVRARWLRETDQGKIPSAVSQSRASLMGSAATIFEITQGLEDDGDIVQTVGLDLASKGDLGQVLALSVARSGREQAEIIGFHRWAESGFPVLTMGHKFAAAMCCTSATEEVVSSAMPPFHGYLLEVPDGLIAMTDPITGLPADIRFVLIARCQNPRVRTGFTWSYSAMTVNGYVLYRYGVNAAELLPPDIEASPLESGIGRQYLVTDRDERACAMVGRLVVNTALAMSDPSRASANVPKKCRHKMNSPFTGRREPEPVCRTYVVGKDVKLRFDLREEVRRYVAGERRSVNVQVLVCGHYKMQPHGPRNSLRKQIWREPFWRGPEDGPIPIRSHVLGDSL